MSRIPLVDLSETRGAVREEWDRQVAAHGRMTHMKRTLAHSWPALRALMEWYPLEAEVRAFLGARPTTLFAHAISAETDCLICSTFFRRALVESGEDADRLDMNEMERQIVAFGRRLAGDPNGVTDAEVEALRRRFTPEQVVALTAFGAMMVATNVFNNALGIELDGYLRPFAKPARGSPGPEGRHEGGHP